MPGLAIDQPAYWRHPVSATFHGRDVFAPAAAHLSNGVTPETLGDPTATITALALPIPRPEGNVVRGQIVFADAFGNLVSDITADILADMGVIGREAEASVSIAGREICRSVPNFPRPARRRPEGIAGQPRTTGGSVGGWQRGGFAGCGERRIAVG